jgi:BASS family bile acid:Na+ symporter
LILEEVGVIMKQVASFPAFVIALVISFGMSMPLVAGEDMYRNFMRITQGKGEAKLFDTLNEHADSLDWEKAETESFEGNIRLLVIEEGNPGAGTKLYMVRNITGELHILDLPAEDEPKEVKQRYAGLDEMLGDKYIFNLKVIKDDVGDTTYSFVRLVDRPSRTMLDRVFKISIVLMLFFVMVGMGLTLTVGDFKRVFQKPKAILTGAVLQWALMPLVAVALGHLLGFYETFPFIFVGMVLITVSPGGVTSNLMTYYSKGDLALSISLTSFSTVLSLFFTPFLLALYCANVPEVQIPVMLIIQTIIILVIIPLAIGMVVQAKATKFAQKAIPFFSALGIIALLFLIIAGVLSNIEVFKDTERYSFKFYSMVFTLTLLGMIVGVVFPKLLRISNYQVRAISLETGLRNASLAMALALLIQDFMGDFYSSMFVTSAMFGLLMYVAGFISIWFFRKFLPTDEQEFDMEIKSDDEA